MGILETLNSLGGAARTGQLIALGLTKRDIAAARAAGIVGAPRRGVVALPGIPTAVALAAEHRAALTCASATEHYGLWRLNNPDKIHLAANHHRLPHSVRAHYPELRPGHGLIATKLQVLVHTLHCLPSLDALVVLESAAKAGFDLDLVREKLPGGRNGRRRRLLRHVDPSSDSPLETVARVLFRMAGFEVETQVYIDGVGWVDFLIEGRIIVEIDGLEFHLSPRQFAKDRHRDNAAAGHGLRSLRFTYDDVIRHPERMIAAIHAAIGATPR
ncbi:DUF559 domain-containing protein [Sinomonas sp. ASV322]|uniref:endonuclease domain-containing protein n=1 Tax=Sinomonas sp. ASV322 TaxID=3041920 RepID=UPI0027DBB94A|nr:DUF559 domain-containing protein [Sinomonas sp. ASV322]MDQ4501418.1 DUF559 domain-containing protein [Sinomonas sp. ASV322]